MTPTTPVPTELDATASTPQPYWFHAKRYGWGWGLPARREGWIVLIVWLVIFITVSTLLAGHHPGWFMACTVTMVLAFLGVCYAKGEPPRWRWGNA